MENEQPCQGNKGQIAEKLLKGNQRSPWSRHWSHPLKGVCLTAFYIAIFEPENIIIATNMNPYQVASDDVFKASNLLLKKIRAGLANATVFSNAIFPGKRSERIIDAKHKFAKKRFDDRYLWKPTPEIESMIAAAIFKNRSST